MTKNQILILISAFAIILFFTNPSEINHIDSVKSKLKSLYKKEMANNLMNDTGENSFSSIGNGLGLLFGDIFIDKMTDGFISRENYYLFSLTKAEFNGEENIIGLGIIGNVYLSDKINDIFKNKNQQ